MSELTHAAVSIALAIVGVAILAVLVSKNANTVGVIGASGNAFSRALTAAEGTVLGGSFAGGNSMYGPGYFG